jgi:hypothetical protein
VDNQPASRHTQTSRAKIEWNFAADQYDSKALERHDSQVSEPRKENSTEMELRVESNSSGFAAGKFYRPELDVLRFVAFLMVYLAHTIPVGQSRLTG